MRYLWWIKPEVMCFLQFIVLPVIILLSPPEMYIPYHTTKFADMSSFHYFGLAALLFWCGQFCASLGKKRQLGLLPSNAGQILKNAYWTAYTLTIGGYAVWLASAVSHGLTPGMLLNLLMASDDVSAAGIRKNVFVGVPGLSSFTQAGLIAAAIAPLLWRRGGFITRSSLLLLLLLSFIRGTALSERLALIEILIPMLLTTLAMYRLKIEQSRVLRQRCALVPIWAVTFVLCLFGVGEFYRTWGRDSTKFDNFGDFITQRLVGYYGTAINNGIIYLNEGEELTVPLYTLQWVWSNPVVSQSGLNYTTLTGQDPAGDYISVLNEFAIEELNNWSGILTPFKDYPYPVALAFWFTVGIIYEIVFRSWLAGNLLGLIMYGYVFTSLLDVARVYTLTGPRYLPAFIVGMGIVLLLSHRYNQQQYLDSQYA